MSEWYATEDVYDFESDYFSGWDIFCAALVLGILVIIADILTAVIMYFLL